MATPDTGLGGGPGGGFPFDGHTREESLSRWACLVQYFIAAVTVVASRASADENLRPSRQARDGSRQRVRTVHPAFPDSSSFFGCPPQRADRLAGQMHHRIRALQPGMIDVPGLRVPADVAGLRGPGGRSYQASDLVSVSAKVGDERRPDQPGRAADGDAHLCQLPVRWYGRLRHTRAPAVVSSPD